MLRYQPPPARLQRRVEQEEGRPIPQCAVRGQMMPRRPPAAPPRVHLLAYGAEGRLLLVIAALNFGGGAWYLSIARSRTARA